jgi:hypothetical protein
MPLSAAASGTLTWRSSSSGESEGNAAVVLLDI